MLRPSKHLDLDSSVLAIVTLVLKKLIHTKQVKHEELVQFIVSSKGEKAKRNILPAIDFLFLAGKIAYIKDIDCFELTK